MTHRRLLQGAAANTVALTLMCTALTAQAPSPTDTRNVTAVGCLKQERDVPGRATREGRDRTDAFVLVNTRITTATGPDTAAAPSDATAPSGSPGASASGTSSTGSTSMQSSDRPASTAAKPTAPAGSQTMYRVTGLPDDQLRPHLNKQVEIRATLDTAALGAAVRQPGATMGTEPASTPSASAPPPAAPPGQGQAPSTQADRGGEKAPGQSDLPELRAMTIRATGGGCTGT